MIENFLANPFANSKLGTKRFLKYATVHLARLRAASGLSPATLARLDQTEAAITALRQLVETDAQTGARRKGNTSENDKAIKKFKSYVSQQAQVLGALFTDLDKDIRGEDTAAYLQFFPQGVTALTDANKATLDTEAAVFLKAADDQKAQVGAALGTRARELWLAVTISRGAQLSSMGGEGDLKPQRDAARRALADELFLNLLTLLIDQHQQPEKVRAFFPESILKEWNGPDGDPKAKVAADEGSGV